MASMLVSVIIPAFRYSNALACAIESVLRQTHEAFELLVISDGPCPASEDITKSFSDRRLVWKSLPGHMAGADRPRNEGLKAARGTFIAYLDQDDLWYPTHLATCLKMAEEKKAEVVVSTLLRYGVPGSGLIDVSGVFPEGQYTADLFIPASSLFHHRSVIDKIGYWARPLFSRLPIDGDFISRLHLAKCMIVPTGALTVFQFPSRWRWQSYTLNAPHEQQEMLARIRAGEDICQCELMRALTSLASGEGQLIKMPNPHIPPKKREDEARYVKGLLLQPGPAQEDQTGTLHITMEEGPIPHEWHPLENNATIGSFRWSGPGRIASILLPARPDRAARINLTILWFINPDDAKKLKIRINGQPQDFSVTRDHEGIYHVTFDYQPESPLPATQALLLQCEVPRTYPPQAFDINADLRFLGLALHSIDCVPLDCAENKKRAVS